MDFSSLPSQLVYKTRKTLEEFTNNNELNEKLVDEMSDIYLLQSPNFKQRATTIFNAAYYICTLISVDEHPLWNFSKYCNIALCNNINNVVEQAFSLSIVRIYLSNFDEKWQDKHKYLEKLDNYLKQHYIDTDTDCLYGDYSFYDVYSQLDSFDVYTASFPPAEFSLGAIDQESIDEMRIANFNWTQFTNYYRENIMRDIVFYVGKTEDEMKLLVNSLHHDADSFYTADNSYYEKIKCRLKNIEQDIHRHFHAEEETENEIEAEEGNYQQRVMELENENAKLRAEIAQMKEMCSVDIKIEEAIDDKHKCITEMIVELLKPIFYGEENNVKEFLALIKDKTDIDITYNVSQWIKESKISNRSKGRPLWQVLHAAKFYRATEQNWNAALRNH